MNAIKTTLFDNLLSGNTSLKSCNKETTIIGIQISSSLLLEQKTLLISLFFA
jgi:hypothetical protein